MANNSTFSTPSTQFTVFESAVEIPSSLMPLYAVALAETREKYPKESIEEQDKVALKALNALVMNFNLFK